MRNKNIVQINHSLLEGMGGQKINQPSDFARIRSFGDKNSAITHDGIKVFRQEFIFVEGYGMVRCPPTTMHFVYEDTSKKRGRWAFMCTCGGIAGVISYKDIVGLISPELGQYVLMCIHGLSNKQATGVFKHVDGSSE